MKDIEIYKIINDKSNHFLIELLSDNPRDERSLYCIGLSKESNDLNDNNLLTCRKIDNNKLTFLNMLFSENYSIEVSSDQEKEIILKKLSEIDVIDIDESFKMLHDEMRSLSKSINNSDKDIEKIDNEFYNEIGKKLGS